jgi:non-ribosomal peptide synthetase component F
VAKTRPRDLRDPALESRRAPPTGRRAVVARVGVGNGYRVDSKTRKIDQIDPRWWAGADTDAHGGGRCAVAAMEPVLPARVDGLFEARAAAADLRCRHALLRAADGEAGAAQGATTYAELASRARTLSEALRSAGVRPGCVVALCADRSVAFVVAALGVLRLGAAFAPVATSDPPSRYARLLARCAALVAEQPPLASSKEAGPLPRCARAFSGAVIQLDRDGTVASVVGTAQGCEHEPLDPAVAYVLLTSGSTGHPKGYAQQQSHHTVAHTRPQWLSARVGRWCGCAVCSAPTPA